LGAAVGIGVKKLAAFVYLSPRRLQSYPDSFVRYVIAHELAHIFLDHVEQLLLSTLTDSEEEDEALYESQAKTQAELWGFSSSLRRRPKRNKIAVGKERRKK